MSRRSAARAQAGRAAVRSRLDDVPALFELLLPLIQNPEGTQLNVTQHGLKYVKYAGFSLL